jgi:hypothetical protein
LRKHFEITKARRRKSNEWKKVELLREEEDGTKVYSLLWNEYRLYLYPSGEMKVKPTTQVTANKLIPHKDKSHL